MVLLAAWGSNGSGQCALGDTEDRALPALVSCSSKIDVEHLSCGVRHSTAFSNTISSDGQVVFTILRCGEALDGSSKECSRNTFDVSCNIESSVRLISSGWDFDVFVTDRDRLSIAGCNPDVLVNNGSQLAYVDVDHIATACAGLRHVVAATKTGNVFAWGSNRYGQLGRVESSSESAGRVVADAKTAGTSLNDAARNGRVELARECINVKKCVAGEQHTVLLTAEGSLIAFGANRFGQCAKECTRVVAPHCIDTESFGDLPVVDVACGWSHTLALTANGKVYSFGRANYGQLGRAHSDPRADPVPRQVHLISADSEVDSTSSTQCEHVDKQVQVTQIACGAEHSAVVTDDGRLFVCGWNEHGNCGDGSQTNLSSFKQVGFTHLEQELGCRLRVDRVATGGAHLFAFLSCLPFS